MENRFAGAQDHGNRRRRWLSQEEGTESGTEFDAPQDIVSADHPNVPLVDPLVRSMVSSRRWLIGLVILASTVLCSVLICRTDDASRHFGTEVAARPPEDITTRCAGLLLLLASGYALLIGGIRADSAVDFKGRYRCWRWLAACLGTMGVVQILGVGPMVPALLSELLTPLTGTIQAARPAVTFAISLTISTFLLSRVLPDMGRCVWSQATLTAAVLIMIVRFMLQHSAHGNVQTATLDALYLLAANTTFAATLMHCRFVAYVNNAPPITSLPNQSRSDLPADRVGEADEDRSSATDSTVDAQSKDQKDVATDQHPVSVDSAADTEDPHPQDADPAWTDPPPPKPKRRKSKRKRRAA